MVLMLQWPSDGSTQIELTENIYEKNIIFNKIAPKYRFMTITFI